MNIAETRHGVETSLPQYKALVGLLFNEVREQSMDPSRNSGLFYPGIPGSPEYRYELDGQNVIFDIQTTGPEGEEQRSYAISETTIKKAGYVERFPGSTIYTDEKEDYLAMGFITDEDLLADPIEIPFKELETLAKLIFDPQGNANLLDLLPHLPATDLRINFPKQDAN